MSSTFGQQLKLSIFGQSHGEAIGVTLDGFPGGMPIDMARLTAEMARRAPDRAPSPPPARRRTHRNSSPACSMA